MLTPRILAARLWPSALSPHTPAAPQAEKLSQCLLLAVLMHALLLLWIGTAPGGTAKPGDGVWGRLNVTLTGGTGDQNAVRPQAAPTQAQQGPVGKGRQERHGGTVRPAEAPQPLPMTPGAAREGEWASRVPKPGEATDALASISPDAKEAAPSSDIAPKIMAQTQADAAQAPAPSAAPAPAPAPAPPQLPELRSLDTQTLPSPAALAEPTRSTAVLSAPPGRELPSAPRLKKNRAPSESLGRVPVLANTAALSAPALEAKTLPSLPPVLWRIDDLPSPLFVPDATRPLAELRQAPAVMRRLDAPPPRPAALSERLPAIAKSDAAALPPPTLSPPLALPAARLPASRIAAVPKLQPLPTMPTEPLAKAPEVPAALPVQAPSETSAVAAKAAEPAASSAAALASTQAVPAVVATPTPAPSPATATATTASTTPTSAQPSPSSEAPPQKATAASLTDPGGARPRLGSPDAGPRLGRDVATPASASPEVKPLNLTLPRGGELSARGSRGVLPLMPLPPERKSKLSESMEEAKRADCRKAYGETLGLLAVVPLAVDAVRGGTKGCAW
ncbi:hypothetical protein WG899_00410 [Paucibacter sp. AS339]|uniref:hypothetical protein n=1 Tax=Paucibacter hankyongi TaxID=3133434 RepID=UPI00309E2BB9